MPKNYITVLLLALTGHGLSKKRLRNLNLDENFLDFGSNTTNLPIASSIFDISSVNQFK